MKVLQFGADVKVLEPKELIREIREEIKRMQGVYGARRKAHRAKRIGHSAKRKFP